MKLMNDAKHEHMSISPFNLQLPIFNIYCWLLDNIKSVNIKKKTYTLL